MEVEAVFQDGCEKTYTKSLTQFDHKASLHISGVLLPEKFEAHFSNDEEGGISNIVKGENYKVRIPDVYLQSGDYVYIWIYVEKASMYKVVVPVNRRPMIYEMNDGNDEGEKTYAFKMDDDDTLVITTIDADDETPTQQQSQQQQLNENSGWVMSDDETIEFRI